jgi:hypothetical protein
MRRYVTIGVQIELIDVVDKVNFEDMLKLYKKSMDLALFIEHLEEELKEAKNAV